MKKIVQKALVRAACIVSLSGGYFFYADLSSEVVGWTKKHQITMFLGLFGILALLHFVWDDELKSLKTAYEASVNFEALNRLAGIPEAQTKVEKSDEGNQARGGEAATNAGN